MEEITIADLFAEVALPTLEFVAEYDPENGNVLSVGPSSAFTGSTHTVNVDEETAMMIIEGKRQLANCFVDIDSDQLEFVETVAAFKIDDVLHRIPNRQWAEIPDIDVYICYNSKSKDLKFELSEQYQGTKKFPKNKTKRRRIKWTGDTQMFFLITDYNDPNVIHQVIEFCIDDLIGRSKIIKNVVLSLNRSIYTRRLFKNYVVEYK